MSSFSRHKPHDSDEAAYAVGLSAMIAFDFS
jgi:hypothetical protein